jgi:hypothetical protein
MGLDVADCGLRGGRGGYLGALQGLRNCSIMAA